MKEPTTLEEYNKLFRKNQRYEGFGLETRIVIPCPFCAAPDFAVFKVLDMDDALAKEKICKNCGRGAKTITTRKGGTTQIEVVQTCGSDVPAFMPEIRRISDE